MRSEHLGATGMCGSRFRVQGTLNPQPSQGFSKQGLEFRVLGFGVRVGRDGGLSLDGPEMCSAPSVLEEDPK